MIIKLYLFNYLYKLYTKNIYILIKYFKKFLKNMSYHDKKNIKYK